MGSDKTCRTEEGQKVECKKNRPNQNPVQYLGGKQIIK